MSSHRHASGLSRRQILQALPAAAALAASPLVRAAGYPERPIRLVVPSAAGGSPDAICRVIANALQSTMGATFVIDNKPGASGNIGIVDVAHAAGDGYTLGYANVGTLAINKSLFSKLPYDAEKQLAPVALLGFVQNALVVRKELGVNSVKELIALAKAKPGTLSMGSAGSGTTGHLGGELFKTMTGTYIVHVPYRGSPQAIQDLMGGQIDLMFDNLSSIAPHIQAGRLKVLAVTGAKRSPLFPDIPTVAESGVPGYDVVAWGGLVAPAAMPKALIAQLNGAINTAIATPSCQEKYAAIGFETLQGPPEALFDRARRETPIWADAVKRSGAQVG
ncbi:tripartite tricarboxylate transporter substrate binding protein [Xylophilus rhododendri]|uniref:Tripartite tricarboxylate transporter substrate binding protein n=1 Tax=Xylophilus rhododendri TaxID=2697032 RepID=A0A857JAH9_9BURK|nr:tripartite tricarboxylate transporter substrate binding protein [Xylophilus rhododendri]QHJ01021.1 tripartite tricarboxylate transporter substrate binding protein [Xylophilus rhododendri]